MKSGDLSAYYDEVYFKTGVEWAYSEKLSERFFSALFEYFKIPKGSRVLDIGCGTGFHDMILRKLGYAVIGVDISRVGVELGKKHFPDLSLVVADAYHLPFRVEAFDVVFLYGCSLFNTETVQEVQDLIALLLRFVSPRGMLLSVEHTNLSGVADSVSRRSNRAWKSLRQYVVDTGYAPHLYLTHFRAVACFGRLALNSLMSGILRLLRGKRQWMAIHHIQRTLS